MRLRWILLIALLAGCASSHGRVGMLASSAEVVGTKLIRPGATGRSCRSSIIGVPLGSRDPEIGELLAQMFALDSEADVVINVDVRSSTLLTGVYNRRCVEIHGDLARSVPTIALPAPASHGQHSGHH